MIDATLEALKAGKPVDRQLLEHQWREFDLKFARTVGGHFALKPDGDFYSMSRQLFNKYALPAAVDSSSAAGVEADPKP